MKTLTIRLECCGETHVLREAQTESDAEQPGFDYKVSTPLRLCNSSMLGCYLPEGWNARLVPYQSQKTVRTTPGIGRLFFGAAYSYTSRRSCQIKMSSRVVLVVRENFVGLETHLAETFARLIDHLF